MNIMLEGKMESKRLKEINKRNVGTRLRKRETIKERSQKEKASGADGCFDGDGSLRIGKKTCC